MKLDRGFRVTLYGTFSVLFATGAGWFVADQLKDSQNGELWQQVSANLLMAHGGVAMLALLFLGALGPVHVRRGWRGRKNRMTGIVVVALNATLIATAFGLYYLGSDAIRPWTSLVHLVLGLCLPAILVAHIVVGRLGRR